MILDIETGIESFEITVVTSRLVSRLKKHGEIPVIEALARVTAHLYTELLVIKTKLDEVSPVDNRPSIN